MSVDAVLIAGPTASGKSAAALALAERIGGALINTDSMQVYMEARILSARPGESEMARAPHFLFGHVSAHERYSAARFAEDAASAFAQARAAGRVPIFVGGTGLYFSTLTEGIADVPRVPSGIRLAVKTARDRLGAEAFFAELARRDPRTAARLRASDTQRTLRAWEVMEATGRPLSEWQTAAPKPLLAGLVLAKFVVSPPREKLHRRIGARFDAMVAAGALDEAMRLAGVDPTLPSAKILGRRELLAVGTGQITLEEAKTQAKAATRQYAKRQLTWARHRMADWRWAEDTSNIITVSAEKIS
jgi:tRNA dimethylallyltransferase